MPSSKSKYNVIIGGVLLHLALGTLYSWGCVQPYVTSYLRLHQPTVTIQDTTVVYACASLGQSFTAPLVGLLQDRRRLGLRGTAAVGATLVALATLTSAASTTVVGLAVLNIFFGVGLGLAYTCPLVSGYAWVPDRKGTVTGFVVAGFGAGAAVFDSVATAVVNPNDAPVDGATGYYGEEVAGRVPLMYLVLGSCYMALGLLGSWMIADPPAEGSSSCSRSISSKTSNGSRSKELSGNYERLPSLDGNGCSGINNSSQRTVNSRRSLLQTKLHRRHYRCDNDNDIDDGDDDDRHAGDSAADGGCGELSPLSSSGHHTVATAKTGDDVRGERGPDGRPGVGSPGFAAAGPLPWANTAVNGDGVGRGAGYALDHKGVPWQHQRGDGEGIGSGSRHTMDIVHLPITAAARDTEEGGVDVRGEKGGGVKDVASPAGEGGPQLEVWSLLVEVDFYHLALTMLCTCASGLYIAGNYKGIARDVFPDADRFLSILGSVASLCNAAGRVVGGLSVDRFGCFATLLVQASSATCLLLALRVVHADRTFFFLAICLMHSLYGSNFAIYPTLTAEFFGAATAGSNYGLVFMVFGFGSFLIILLLAARAETSDQVFLECAAVCLAGAASAAFLWARRRRRDRDRHRRKACSDSTVQELVRANL